MKRKIVTIKNSFIFFHNVLCNITLSSNFIALKTGIFTYKLSFFNKTRKIWKNLIKTFTANAPLLYPSKTIESRRFCDVFRGYVNGTWDWNGLMQDFEKPQTKMFSIGIKISESHTIFDKEENELHAISS